MPFFIYDVDAYLKILSACEKPLHFERILQAVFERYGLAMDLEYSIEIQEIMGNNMKKWIPALFAVCVPLSACSQDDGGKAAIDVTKSVKAYETMSYGEFKEQTGNEAESYHGDRFAGEIPDSSVYVIYSGEYDEETAAAVLADDDMPIRLQGPLGDLLVGIEEEMTLTEFTDALSADGAAEAASELLEGGGTAYYVGNKYAEIKYDSDKDGEYDRRLSISLDESEGEMIGSDSIAWLEII